jgi:hypothetical protein
VEGGADLGDPGGVVVGGPAAHLRHGHGGALPDLEGVGTGEVFATLGGVGVQAKLVDNGVGGVEEGGEVGGWCRVAHVPEGIPNREHCQLSTSRKVHHPAFSPEVLSCRTPFPEGTM